VIVWVGSLIVTLNTKLVGGNISFFQSVCVLGKNPFLTPPPTPLLQYIIEDFKGKIKK